MKQVTFLWLLAVLNCGTGTAQTTTQTSPEQKEAFDPFDQVYQTKLDKPFALLNTYQTIDGKTIDFAHLARPTFVSFGFYGCHPCMHELPVFVEAANAYPEVDFVYVTFDTEQLRQREFNEAGLQDYKPATNYYIIHIDRADIDNAKVTVGYPTKYILNHEGIVKYMKCGGNSSQPVAQIRNTIDALVAKFAKS